MSPHEHAGHGHAQDRGLRGFVRYMKMLPKMWRSPVSREVVRTIAPTAGEQVVDVGAGMGPAAVQAAKTGASVLAVDPTPYMRHITRSSSTRPAPPHRHPCDRRIRRVDPRRRSHRRRVVDGQHHASLDGSRCGGARTGAGAATGWAAAAGRRGLRLARRTRPLHTCRIERADRAHHFAEIDPVAVRAKLTAAGFANAEGSTGSIGRSPGEDRPRHVLGMKPPAAISPDARQVLVDELVAGNCPPVGGAVDPGGHVRVDSRAHGSRTTATRIGRRRPVPAGVPARTGGNDRRPG